MASKKEFIDIMKDKYTEGMSDIKEIALTEKMVELIFKTGSMKSRILCYMRKRNIKSALEFMNRKFYVGKWDGSGSDQDGQMPSNTGAKCCKLIEEIQKDLAKEGKKELKKVPITTYEWRLIKCTRYDYSKVRVLAKKGMTRHLISEKLKIPYPALWAHCKEHNIKIKNNIKINVYDYSRVETLIAKKDMTFFLISKKLKIPYSTLLAYCRRNNIPFKEARSKEARSKEARSKEARLKKARLKKKIMIENAKREILAENNINDRRHWKWSDGVRRCVYCHNYWFEQKHKDACPLLKLEKV